MPEQPTLTLRDLHLPEPAGWWPPAPGWWLLAALLLLLPLIGWALRRRQRRRPRYRRAALAELQRIEHGYRSGGDGARAVAETSALLKRVALSCYPTELVAPLGGAQWADFLARDDDPALRQTLRALLEQVHRGGPPADIEPLFDFADRWIRAQQRL